MTANEINLINQLNEHGYTLLLVDENDVRLLNMKLEEIFRFDIIESDLYLSIKEFIDMLVETNEEENAKPKFKRIIIQLESIVKNVDVFGGEVERYPDLSCVEAMQ